MKTQQSIERLFQLMTDWRRLPAYQLERRMDIFFALYLDSILKPAFPDLKFDLVIPEFPLRLGTLREGVDRKSENRSVKVDYACFDTSAGVCVMLELKTDDGSARDLQYGDMMLSSVVGMGKLLEGLAELRRKSQSKPKYDHLLHLLQQAGLVEIQGANRRDHQVTPTPKAQACAIRLAVIKPTSGIAVERNAHFSIISFREVRQAIAPLAENDDVAKAFHSALGAWDQQE